MDEEINIFSLLNIYSSLHPYFSIVMIVNDEFKLLNLYAESDYLWIKHWH